MSFEFLYYPPRNYKTFSSIALTHQEMEDRVQASTIAGGNHYSMDPGFRFGAKFSEARLIYDAPANYSPAAYYALKASGFDLSKPLSCRDIKEELYTASDELYVPIHNIDSVWKNAKFYDVSHVVDANVKNYMAVLHLDKNNVPEGCAPVMVRFYFSVPHALVSFRWRRFKAFPYIMIGEGGVLAATQWAYPIVKETLKQYEKTRSRQQPPTNLFHFEADPVSTSSTVLTRVNRLMRIAFIIHTALTVEIGQELTSSQMKDFVDKFNEVTGDDAKLLNLLERLSKDVVKNPHAQFLRNNGSMISYIDGDVRIVQEIARLLTNGVRSEADVVVSFLAGLKLSIAHTIVPQDLTLTMTTLPFMNIMTLISQEELNRVGKTHKATDEAVAWSEADPATISPYSDLVKYGKVDELTLSDLYGWDHAGATNGVFVASPTLLLFRMERCVIDSVTTIVSTLKGAAQRGGLSMGIYPLLQLSSWTESFAWYAATSDDDPLARIDLAAQVAGSSGMLKRIKFGTRSIFSGFVASSRRYKWRGEEFIVSRAKIVDGKLRVLINGFAGRYVKTVTLDDFGDIVTEDVTACQPYTGREHPYDMSVLDVGSIIRPESASSTRSPGIDIDSINRNVL